VILYLIQWLLFYPASGYRNNASGAFSDIGSLGFDWSSASSGTIGYYLRFMTTEVQPIRNSSVRANGYGVRCVQYLLLLE